MIEYIHLPKVIAERRQADGSLMFWAGNVAVHVFDVSFLARLAREKNVLPLHHSLKKVPFVNDAGELVQPQQPNAWRFERFIFDLLPHAANALLVEADRNECFAPVKNAEHEANDNARTSRTAISALHTQWLTAAGADIAPGVTVEINPLFALDAAELKSKIKPGTRIETDHYFSP
jgi:UDP-N-acetylglucosamine/UDP-N-acetylgalactosamine diphosphorylase